MIRFLARGLLFSLMALLLASCDSGNDSVDVPGVSGYTLTVQTVDATTGLVDTQASAAAPLRVVATLTNASGTAVSGATIVFSATGIGELGTATAQTNGTGVASVILNAGTSTTPGTSSSGVVTVRFTDPDVNVASDTQNYTTLGDEVASGGGGGPTPTNVLRITLAAQDGLGNPISSTNPVTTTNGGRLVVSVTLDGIPVPNAFVTFTAPATATLSPATAATSASGNAEVSVTATGDGAGLATAAATYGTQTVNASVVISTSVVATAPVTLDIGNLGNTGTYTDGVLATSATGPLAQGSTITVRADVVDVATNLAYTTPVTVKFTSACASQATPTALIDAEASTIGGRVQVTYRPTSCVGTDTITATLVDGSRTVTAVITVNVLAPTIAQVAFVSATPTTIALGGTGGMGRLTRSEVKFRVLGDTGTPIGNQLVCFGLSSTVGGLTVNASGRTNSSGEVIAAVQAGSVPTSVRVQATVDTDNDNNCTTVPTVVLSAVSDALSVSTGLPDQKSFSLAFSTKNPHAWEVDGAEVEVSVYSADHFSNPVPDGTAISFWTELGSIEPSCTTVAGVCSVTWRSQSPRVNRDLTPDVGTNIQSFYGSATGMNDRHGRATVLAYAVGEESFNDANGNGRYDSSSSVATDELFGDLPEAIKDSNENGLRSRPGAPFGTFQDEEFIDFNGNGSSDPVNGRYDGVLCGTVIAAKPCSGDATVNVRASGVIVMSSNVPRLMVFGASTFNKANVDFDVSGSGVMTGIPGEISSLNILTAPGVAHFVLTDKNGNAPPAGSKVTATVSPSTAGVLVGPSSYTVPSQTEFFEGTFTVRMPTGTPTGGALMVTVESGGISYAPVSIDLINN